MSVSISLSVSPTLASLLQTKATLLGMSLNDMVEKVLSDDVKKIPFPVLQQSKIQEEQASPISFTGDAEDTAQQPVSTQPVNDYLPVDDGTVPSMSEIVATIQSRPHKPKKFHPATGTLDDVIAVLEANEPETPPWTPEEWEKYWWPVRQEMCERDRAREPFFIQSQQESE